MRMIEAGHGMHWFFYFCEFALTRRILQRERKREAAMTGLRCRESLA